MKKNKEQFNSTDWTVMDTKYITLCFFFLDRKGTNTPLTSSDVYFFGVMIENVCIF